MKFELLCNITATMMTLSDQRIRKTITRNQEHMDTGYMSWLENINNPTLHSSWRMFNKGSR